MAEIVKKFRASIKVKSKGNFLEFTDAIKRVASEA
jgi:hypothetical protein